MSNIKNRFRDIFREKNFKIDKWILLGGGIGAFFFLTICGISILNPFYYEWIFNGGSDAGVSFLGWLFYEQTPWRDTFWGSFDSTYPHELSIVFSDAIVPFAIIFKTIFGWMIPDGVITQYIGLWGFMCYLLQGIGTGLIVKKILNNNILRVSCIIFLCGSPLILRKLFGHNTLTAQWLILFAFCLFLYEKELGKKRYWLWIMLVVVGTTVHIYFLPILAIIMVFSMLYDAFISKSVKYPIATIFAAIVCSLVTIYVLGVFTSEVSEGDSAWGYSVLYECSSNLNTFFNPEGDSLFLPALKRGSHEYSGYGYLGLGGIFLTIIALFLYFISLSKRKDKKSSREYRCKCFCIFGCFLLSFALAVGPKITFFEHTLFVIPIPRCMEYVFATFRVIGRFIWISDYIVIFTAFYLLNMFICNKIKKLGVECLVVMLTFVQLVDLYPAYKKKHSLYAYPVKWESEMKDEQWEWLAGKYKYIYAITANVTSNPNNFTNSMMLFVYNNNLKITSTYYAHPSNLLYEESLQYMEEILEGRARKDTIYWFENEDYMNEARPYLHCEVIDGYYLGWME